MTVFEHLSAKLPAGLARHAPRILTGVLLVALLATTMYLGGVFFFAFLLLFSLAGLWEFYSLFWPGHEHLLGRLGAVTFGGLLLGMSAYWPHLVVPGLSVGFMAMTVFFLFAWSRDENVRFSGVAILASGLLYVPLLLAPALHFSVVEQIFLICAAAVSDTTAYFMGMYFGKRKIWPQVSPKKTVVGSVAGLVACVLLSVALGLLLGKASATAFALLALGLGIMAQLGDFFESALKRSRHIKDSGSLLPGHGGVLDRADSLLFVIPTYAVTKAFWTFF